VIALPPGKGRQIVDTRICVAKLSIFLRCLSNQGERLMTVKSKGLIDHT
jgi:hypothetical protein